MGFNSGFKGLIDGLLSYRELRSTEVLFQFLFYNVPPNSLTIKQN